MEPLPRGRHGLSPQFVAQHQRDRLISGLTEVVYEVGCPNATVALIGARASVSKSDFYKHFGSKGDCFDAAYDAAVSQIRKRIETACAAEQGAEWAGRVSAGIGALFELCEEQPALVSLVLVEGPRAGRSVQTRYRAAVEDFAPFFQRGAPVAGEVNVPGDVGLAVVGGVASLVSGRVAARDTERLEELQDSVREFALAPYLGAAEARRIVSGR